LFVSAFISHKVAQPVALKTSERSICCNQEKCVFSNPAYIRFVCLQLQYKSQMTAFINNCWSITNGSWYWST